MSLLVSSPSGSVSALGGGLSSGEAPIGFEALLAALTGGSSDESALKAGIETLFGSPVVELEFEADVLVGVQLAGQEGKLSSAELAEAAGIALAEDAGETGDAQKLLVELLERLSGLAEDPDIEKLAEIGDLLDALAGLLDLPLSPAPEETELARLGANLLKEDATPAERLSGLLADLAGVLTADNGVDATLARAVGGKLGVLAAALDNGGEAFAALGMTDDALPADLEARIASLIAEKAGTRPQQPPAPPSADPRLTETVAANEMEAGTGNRPTTATPSTATPSTATREVPAQSPLASADPRLTEAVAAKETQGRAESQPHAATREAPTQAAPSTRLATDDADTSATLGTIAEIAAQTGTRVETAPVARPVVAGYQTSQQQINLPQIAFEISRQVLQGNTQFQIRLDPPELGRIDVQMEIDRDGNVTARLAVEKAETLDLMQRDQRTLERALAQAGLDGARTNLEFSLRQNPFAQQEQERRGGEAPAVRGQSSAETEEQAPASVVTLYRGTLSAGGINILA